jgi:hypothetical protein
MRKGGIVLSIGSSGGITNDDYYAKDIDLYPNRLASYIRTKYGAVQLVNKCIPSTTTADMLFNRHWWGNIRADIVTVKLGSNDAANVRSTAWTPYSGQSNSSRKGTYTAGINTGAINTPVTGTSGQSTITLLVDTASNLGITVGMQVTGVGIGINSLTGASAQVTQISDYTVTLSVANTAYISSNSSTPSYITFSTGEDVMPADIVTIDGTINAQSDSLYVKNISFICNTSHDAAETSSGSGIPSNYTYWTVAAVSFNVSTWVTAVGSSNFLSSTIPTYLGTWSSSSVAYKKVATTRPPSIVIYRPDAKSEFKAYYCIQNHTSTSSITPLNSIYWREVQSNLYEFSRRLVVKKNVDTANTQIELPHVPTIAYEQNLIEIIAQLRSRNPSVKIIICCPYWLSNGDTRRFNFKQYYNSIDNVSKATTTINSPVVVSHLNNAWDSDTISKYVGDDGLHPNTAGHKRIFNFTAAEGQALYASYSTEKSSSSVVVNTTGTKTFTLSSSTPLGYDVGDTIRVYRTSNSSIYIEGTVSAASSSSISVNPVTSVGGSGTYTDWSFTNTNLSSNFFYQVLDTQYGGLKSIVDGNSSWFVNWIDI